MDKKVALMMYQGAKENPEATLTISSGDASRDYCEVYFSDGTSQWDRVSDMEGMYQYKRLSQGYVLSTGYFLTAETSVNIRTEVLDGTRYYYIIDRSKNSEVVLSYG